jgi:hypothetical protein
VELIEHISAIYLFKDVPDQHLRDLAAGETHLHKPAILRLFIPIFENLGLDLNRANDKKRNFDGIKSSDSKSVNDSAQ